MVRTKKWLRFEALNAILLLRVICASVAKLAANLVASRAVNFVTKDTTTEYVISGPLA
ncbi:MAG: hypothetical protein FWG00_02725 [Coriobacteriia bacterium]|nr:hypothetical protein [Coriobacteriia bacterium]